MTAVPDQGVFASPKAVAAQGKEDLLRLTWTTTTGSSYQGRQITDLPTESFQEVFEVGQRRTRYMGIPPKTAPLLNRSSCLYTMEFAKKPLGDYVMNAQMAKHFKSGSSMIDSKSLPSLPAPLSTYGQEICLNLSPEEMAGARLPSTKKLTSAIGPGGLRSVYTTSLAHDTYLAHPTIGSTGDLRPKDCIQKLGPSPTENSTYRADFTRAQTVHGSRREQRRQKHCT
ncbi:unnamed protein product [Effrenium voratum]|nr:unnamed protein product [Effrenium voratum]